MPQLCDFDGFGFLDQSPFASTCPEPVDPSLTCAATASIRKPSKSSWRKEIVDNVFTLVFAATDTTASFALGWDVFNCIGSNQLPSS